MPKKIPGNSQIATTYLEIQAESLQIHVLDLTVVVSTLGMYMSIYPCSGVFGLPFEGVGA